MWAVSLISAIVLMGWWWLNLVASLGILGFVEVLEHGVGF